MELLDLVMNRQKALQRPRNDQCFAPLRSPFYSRNGSELCTATLKFPGQITIQR